MRYFHQPPDYWLDHCTLGDWTRIYARELRESPPVDDWAAVYFKYDPAPERADAKTEEPEIWENPFPDVTE